MKLPTREYNSNLLEERIAQRSSESRATTPAAVRPCVLKNGKTDYRVLCVRWAGKVSHRPSEVGLNKKCKQ